MKVFSKRVSVVFTVVTSLLVPTVSASASTGGQTSLEATPIQPGIAQVVNVTQYSSYLGIVNGGFADVEYWSIKLTSGDHVNIFGSNPNGNNITMQAYAPGGSSPINSGDKFYSGGGVEFIALRTAKYYLVVTDVQGQIGSTNSYTFKAKVQHSAEIFSPPKIHLVRGARSSITVVVRHPNQSTVTSKGGSPRVVLKLRYSLPSFAPPTWHSVASSFVRDGVATFMFITPRSVPGTVVHAIIALSGPGYISSNSAQVLANIVGKQI